MNIEGLKRQLADGSRQVTPTIVEQFAKLIAGKLRGTSGGNLR